MLTWTTENLTWIRHVSFPCSAVCLLVLLCLVFLDISNDICVLQDVICDRRLFKRTRTEIDDDMELTLLCTTMC